MTKTELIKLLEPLPDSYTIVAMDEKVFEVTKVYQTLDGRILILGESE